MDEPVYIWTIRVMAAKLGTSYTRVYNQVRHSQHQTDWQPQADWSGLGVPPKLFSQACFDFVSANIAPPEEPDGIHLWSISDLVAEFGVKREIIRYLISTSSYRDDYRTSNPVGVGKPARLYTDACRDYLIKRLYVWTMAQMAAEAGVSRDRVNKLILTSEFRDDYHAIPTPGGTKPPHRFTKSCLDYILTQTASVREYPPMDWDARTLLAHAEIELGIHRCWIVARIEANPTALGDVDWRRLEIGDNVKTIAQSSLPLLKCLLSDYATGEWVNRGDIQTITGWSHDRVDRYLKLGGFESRPLRSQLNGKIYLYYLEAELNLPRRYVPPATTGWKLAVEVSQDLRLTGVSRGRTWVTNRMNRPDMALEVREMRDRYGRIFWHLSPAGQAKIRMELENNAGLSAQSTTLPAWCSLLSA